MPGQVLGDLLRIGHMSLNAQAQRLQSLCDQERVERRGGRAEVAQQLHAGLQRERGRPELGEHHTVVARVGGGEAGELAVGPVEGAAVDDHAGDRRAVSAEVLGGRVHDDVGAVGQRLDQVRRGDGVVDDQRHAGVVRDRRDVGDVEDVVLRVGDGLGEERLGVRPHGRTPGLQIVGVLDEADLDADLGQRVVEQVVGAAVEPRARDDVVAGVGEVEDREVLGGLTGRQEQRGDAAFERGDALLDDVLRRVHDPGVDVAGLGQAEQRRGVLGAVERVRRGLVDRQRPRVGRDVRRLAGVDLLGLERPVARSGLLGVLIRKRTSICLWGPVTTDPRLPVAGWRLLNLVNHPGHPTAVGGLPASKPGLDAGTHDREKRISSALSGCQRRVSLLRSPQIVPAPHAAAWGEIPILRQRYGSRPCRAHVPRVAS